MVYDILILGGGPAGLTAALYAKRAGVSVLVLEKTIYGGQVINTPTVENYPGIASITGVDLAMALHDQVTGLGVEVRMEEPTSCQLDTDPKVVTTSRGSYQAKTVILANGVKRRQLGCPGEERLAGRGVSYCATCDGMFYRGKDVAVIGGGNTAVADALYLSRLCGRVYLIHRRDKLRAPDSQRALLEQAGNVEFLWNSRAEELLYEERLTGLKTVRVDGGEGRTLDCAGVFIAVGQVPETSLFAGQVELDEAGYVLAGEDCRTNLPGVFAAGDLRRKPLRQIVTAAADGAVAAQMAEEYLSAL